MDQYDGLKLENQLCFPLYACAKEIVRKYTPFLGELDLTYTQYLVLMVLWEKQEVNVKDLGKCLFLDSGTLTPLLKKLESKGYITRKRSTEDERILLVHITEEGMQLREKAVSIPARVGQCVSLSPEEAGTLYSLLYKVLGCVEKDADR